MNFKFCMSSASVNCFFHHSTNVRQMSIVGTMIADETHTVTIPEQGTEQRESGDLRTGASVSRSKGSGVRQNKIPKFQNKVQL